MKKKFRASKNFEIRLMKKKNKRISHLIKTIFQEKRKKNIKNYINAI